LDGQGKEGNGREIGQDDARIKTEKILINK
jgi:hypothetical protein